MRRLLPLLLLVTACGSEKTWECQLAAGSDPDEAPQLGCEADFTILASTPPSASIPGATSVKTVIDRLDASKLHFQNSKRYPIHWDFAHTHLSGMGLPIVPELSQFNLIEYYSPDRRFILGAVTHYQGPDVWVYEIAPYDTASAEFVTEAYRAIAANAWIGDRLFFHPTSESVHMLVEALPGDVKVITTDELFAGIDYQPLNLGESMGQLRFVRAADVHVDYVGFRDIVVLDAIPNDISVTAGIITGAFQTPLSHINVLSQNRGTPNMAFRGAFDDATLRALDGKWVHLTVGPFDWSIEEVSMAEADAWWELHRPEPLQIQDMDLTVTDLRDVELILDVPALPLYDALRAAVPAFGGKATHFGGLALITEDIGLPDAFAIPMFYYDQFMEQNGFWTQIETMVADPAFLDDPAVRDARLAELRAAMLAAPLDATFEAAVIAKITADYPTLPRCRFRSSTNVEDLEGFTGAGLYTSHTGDVDDPVDTVASAIKETWASAWDFRAFEERTYHSIEPSRVGMALLVHPSFPDEEANGVALTGNIFDTSGLEPGFYVNVQVLEISVVQPPLGVTSDQYIHYYTQPGAPVVFLGHSNQIPAGSTVLTYQQQLELGAGLNAVHELFRPAYGTGAGFYGMDIEFKFDDEASGGPPRLHIKQARPHPGWGL